jgi:hypothetical protein
MRVRWKVRTEIWREYLKDRLDVDWIIILKLILIKYGVNFIHTDHYRYQGRAVLSAVMNLWVIQLQIILRKKLDSQDVLYTVGTLIPSLVQFFQFYSTLHTLMRRLTLGHDQCIAHGNKGQTWFVREVTPVAAPTNTATDTYRLQCVLNHWSSNNQYGLFAVCFFII